MRYPIRAIVAIAVVVFLQLGTSAPEQTGKNGSAAAKNTEPPVLSLRLFSPAHSFPADGPIEIQAELRNEGGQTVLVCRNLDVRLDNSVPCAWKFRIREVTGGGPLGGCGSVGVRFSAPKDGFASLAYQELDCTRAGIFLQHTR